MLLFSRFVLLVACCSLSRLAFIAESLKLVNVETILRVTSQELSYGPNKTMANSNTAQVCYCNQMDVVDCSSLHQSRTKL